ncbi:MAG: prepilin peptidase [Candidatus Omnitrophica bacterium]|nr:prepilin peptidase [Candidatus Omnitrophota bacterium]
MLVTIFVFAIGSIVGSFLNVCIRRMPSGESVVWPGSHCPFCKKRIPAYDNIPFISFLLLKGKCRFCRARISLQYPFVELLTALLFVFSFASYGLTYDFFVYTLFLASLIVVAFIDMRYRIIPDEISIGGMVLGFILASIRGIGFGPLSFSAAPMKDSFLGIIAGAGIIYLSGFLFDLVYFKLLKKPSVQGETSSMGMGDVKLLAMIGAFLGWQKAVTVFFLAPFLGLAMGIVNLLVRKEHVIPYGPFLALAAFISLFWQDKIFAFIFLR